MEAVRYMVFQLDPRQRPLSNILSIQNAKLGHVFLGDVDLHNNVTIVFVAFSPRVVAPSGHEDRFAKTAMRIPDFALPILDVQL